MENAEQVTLWKRAWRLPNGDVHSTRPYASKEELLKAEPEHGVHGNEWCGEPYSYVADEFNVNEFQGLSFGNA